MPQHYLAACTLPFWLGYGIGFMLGMATLLCLYGIAFYFRDRG